MVSFECDIDWDWIDGISKCYELWEGFMMNIKTNKSLICIKLNISNRCINNEINVSKLADILECIAESDIRLKCFQLAFNGECEFDYTSHNDTALKDWLYPAIIKCIKSKSSIRTTSIKICKC